MTVENLNAKVGVDVSSLNKGLGEAKQTFASFAKTVESESARAQAATQNLTKWMEAEEGKTRSLAGAKSQAAAFEKELTAAKAQLAAVLKGEGDAAERVAGKYNLLSGAQQQQLVAVREQITAQRALQEAELAASAAAEKAAAVEVAAAEKAAAAQVAASAKATAAAEAAAAKRLAAARKSLGQNLERAGGALTGGLTVPLAAGAGLAIESGAVTQNAENLIRSTTGATGTALAGLDAAFQRVAARVPQTLNQVAGAVAALSVRTGLAGPALEALATQELNLARVTNSDVNETVRSTTQLFNEWGISTRQQAGTLDLLLRASQASGLQVSALAENLAKFAPALKTMGFSLTDSSALLAAFEKAGIPPQRMLTGLQTALTKLAKAGVTDAHQALEVLIQQLQHAKSPMDALREAGSLFGRTLGVQIVNAVRDGKFNLEQLENRILSSRETVAKAAKDTETFAVKWGEFRNQVNLALAPLGVLLLTVGEKLLTALKPAIDKLAALSGWFGKLSGGAQLGILGVVGAVALLGPAIVSIGRFVTAITEIREAWLALSLVAQGSAGFTAITAGLESLGLGAAAAAVPWVAAFAVMGLAVYGLLNKLEETHPALRNFAAATGRLFGAGPAPQKLGPLPAGSLSQSGGGGDLGAGFRPRFAGPDEAAAAQAQAAQRAAAARLAQARAGSAALLAQINAAEQGNKKLHDTLAKLTPLQKEQKEYAEAAAQAHARLAEVLAGEDNIAGQVAGKYHLMHLNGKDDLTVTLQRIKAAETHSAAIQRVREEINRLNADTRAVANPSKGGQFLANVKGLSPEEIKQYTTEIDKANQHNQQAKATAKAAADAQAADTDSVNRLKDAITRLNVEHLKLLNTRLEDQLALTNDGILYAKEDQFHQGLIDTQAKGIRANEQQTASNKAAQEAEAAHTESLKQLVAGYDAAVAAQNRFAGGTKEQGVDVTGLLAPTSFMGMIEAGIAFRTAQLQDQMKASEAFRAEQEGVADRLASATDAVAVRYQRLRGQTRDLTESQKTLDEALDTGNPLLIQWAAGLADATAHADVLEKTHQRLQRTLQQLAGSFQNVFENAFMNINKGFGSFLQSLLQGFEQMLQQMAAQLLASKLTDVFFGKKNDQGERSGGILDSIIGHFVGHRASGGFVSQDTPYLVGEHGPELFMPSRSGRVVPAGQTAAALAGGGDIHLTMNIQTQDAGSFSRSRHQIASDIQRELRQTMKRNGR